MTTNVITPLFPADITLTVVTTTQPPHAPLPLHPEPGVALVLADSSGDTEQWAVLDREQAGWLGRQLRVILGYELHHEQETWCGCVSTYGEVWGDLFLGAWVGHDGEGEVVLVHHRDGRQSRVALTVADAVELVEMLPAYAAA